MGRGRFRVPLESGPRLDLNRLCRDGFVRDGARSQFGLQWSDGSRASIDADLNPDGWARLIIEHDDGRQEIRLVFVPANFGGRKWFFICPRTYRRVSVLWKPPGSPYFACRQAFRRQVAYLSQFEGPRDRGISRARAIRKRLGGGDDTLAPFPEKPARMRWKTYERLRRADAVIRAGWAADTARLLARFGL
jgi:hypothetical protein